MRHQSVASLFFSQFLVLSLLRSSHEATCTRQNDLANCSSPSSTDRTERDVLDVENNTPYDAALTSTQIVPINDGLCSITMAPRRSLLNSNNNNIMPSVKNAINSPDTTFETALICSQIDDFNYREMVKSIYKLNKLQIQQIHIVASESSVVLSAIDLICDRFNCSKLTVFNVTGQPVPDYNILAGWLSTWPQLEVLDLSNTALKTLQSILPVDAQSPQVPQQQQQHQHYQTLKNLTHLLLDDNEISELNFSLLFEHVPNLRHLSLVNNSIHDIHCNESDGCRARLRTQLESVNLAGNAINCDKTQLWLLKLFQMPLINVKFPDQDHIKCGAPEHFADMTWSQRISVHETRICDQCTCRSLKRTAISVDCHNKNLTALPDALPLNTKILNLTSNRITSLILPSNSKNWDNVTYVHLENNLISSLQPLDANFKFMRNLAALDLRQNKLQEFPNLILERFINLDQVHLSNNPWLCDCESTFAFQEWLQRQFQKVGDKEEIRCGALGQDENGLRSIGLQQRLSSRVIYKLSKSELCPQDNLEEPYDWLDIVNLIMGLAIILIITKVILDYIYQRRTKRLPHFFKLNI